MAKSMVDQPLAAVALRGPVREDPWIALAQRLALQAIRDLYHEDYLKILDTLLWWLDETGGVFILKSIGLESDPDGIFESILQRGRNVKQVHFTTNRIAARDGVAE